MSETRHAEETNRVFLDDLAFSEPGAPVDYAPEIVAEICARLSTGEPLAQICRSSGMPHPASVWRWEQRREEVRQAIARARLMGEYAISTRTRQTARGLGPEQGGDSTGDVARDKLIIETDLKLLAKWNPRKWGEGLQLRHADANGEKLDTQPLVSELLGMIGGGVGQPVSIQAAVKIQAAEPASSGYGTPLLDVTPRQLPSRSLSNPPEPAITKPQLVNGAGTVTQPLDTVYSAPSYAPIASRAYVPRQRRPKAPPEGDASDLV